VRQLFSLGGFRQSPLLPHAPSGALRKSTRRPHSATRCRFLTLAILLAGTGMVYPDVTAPVPDNPLAATAGTARAEALAGWQKAKFGLFLH